MRRELAAASSTRQQSQPYDGQLASSQALTELVESTFPCQAIVYAFGYGSGVFSQNLSKKEAAAPGMLDVILVVDNAQAFHAANQAQNPHHYAWWLRALDNNRKGNVAGGLQRRFLGGRDAKVLFQVLFDDEKQPLKYGVIQYEDFVTDLTQWESLYMAGRLHKPTLEIPVVFPGSSMFVSEENQQQRQHRQYLQTIREAQTTNLQAAVAAAMLLSPLSSTTMMISWFDLYSRVASLSYTGDFRMQVGGEDPNKIQKLVHAPGQLERFHAMYRESDTAWPSILGSLQEEGLLSIVDDKKGNGGGGVEWDPMDVAARTRLIQRLPPAVKKPLLVPSTMTSRHPQDNMANHPVHHNHLLQQQTSLSKTLESIVAPAARYQSMKGILTFGLRNSIKYASAKLAKGLLRKR